MTKINTTITSIGDTVDCVNFDTQDFDVDVIYDHDLGKVLVKWDGKKYEADSLRKLIVHAEHVEQYGE